MLLKTAGVWRLFCRVVCTLKGWQRAKGYKKGGGPRMKRGGRILGAEEDGREFFLWALFFLARRWDTLVDEMGRDEVDNQKSLGDISSMEETGSNQKGARAKDQGGGWAVQKIAASMAPFVLLFVVCCFKWGLGGFLVVAFLRFCGPLETGACFWGVVWG